MGSSQSRHVILHYDPHHHSSSDSTTETADVPNANNFSALKQTATKSFPPLTNEKEDEFVFLSPTGEEIDSDANLNEAFDIAKRIAAEHQKEQEQEEKEKEKQEEQRQQKQEEFVFHIHVEVMNKEEHKKQKEQRDSHDSSSQNESQSGGSSNLATSTASAAVAEDEKYHQLEMSLPLFPQENRSFCQKEQQQQQGHREEKEESNFVDVLFVGSGPVGLFCAVQLKILAPHLRILMLEKHKVYTRQHVLLLEKRSCWFRPSHPKLDDIVKKWPHAVRTNQIEDDLTKLALDLGIVIKNENVTDVAATCRKYHPLCLVGSDGSHSTVRSHFMSHGSKVIQQKQLNNRKESNTVIEADNSGLKEDDIVDRTVMLKYEIKGPAFSLSAGEKYKVLKLFPAVSNTSSVSLFEHVGKPRKKEVRVSVISNNKEVEGEEKKDEEKQNENEKEKKEESDGEKEVREKQQEQKVATVTTTPATMIIGGIPDKMFETTKKINFRSPCRVDGTTPETFDGLAKELRAICLGFLAAKKALKAEQPDISSITIAPVPLRTYRAAWFSESVALPEDEYTSPRQFEIPTFLVGDAAFGVPYFRALNDGFLASSRLAKEISHNMPKKEVSDFPNRENRAKVIKWLQQATNSYHLYMCVLSPGEIIRAKTKAAALAALRGATLVSAVNPVQLVKLDEKVENAIKKVLEFEMKDKNSNNNNSKSSTPTATAAATAAAG